MVEPCLTLWRYLRQVEFADKHFFVRMQVKQHKPNNSFCFVLSVRERIVYCGKLNQMFHVLFHSEVYALDLRNAPSARWTQLALMRASLAGVHMPARQQHSVGWSFHTCAARSQAA
jgi:hypothetical protein